MFFFYHKCVMFSIPISSNILQLKKQVCKSRLINSATNIVFSSAFCDTMQAMDANKYELSAEELLSEFNSCVNVLNTVAPVKTLKPKPRVDPWIEDNICSLRQSCRRGKER